MATYASHTWQVVDATTGRLMRTYVADRGDQLLVIEPQDEQSERALERRQAVSGFDGLGGQEEDYVEAKITEVAITEDGGVVYISPAAVAAALSSGSLEDMTTRESLAARKAASIPIYVGQAEANAMVLAAGMETRRPFTIRTWMDTLAAANARVDRVLITRLVNRTFYARIHLALGAGGVQSVDARPSDSLALALQTKSPIYVAKAVLNDPNSRVSPRSELRGLDLDEDFEELLETAQAV